MKTLLLGPLPRPGIFFLLLFAPFLLQAGTAAAYSERSFQFLSQGEPETLHVKLPTVLHEHYEGKPRHFAYGNYVLEDEGFEMTERLAGAFARRAQKREMDEWGLLNLVVDFVQSLSYQPEIGEYPKYPVETLMDGGGDCEDTSILLAALLDKLGMECALVSPPGHMAVGVEVDGLEGKYYVYAGRKYYYVETTGMNWAVGAIPPAYVGSAKVFSLPSNPGRAAVAFSGPEPEEEEDLEPAAEAVTIAFYRTSVQENYAQGKRMVYRYQLKLEGDEELLGEIEEVQYKFALASGEADTKRSWNRVYEASDGFAQQWTSYENLPMQVRIFFKDGRVVQTLLRPDE